MERPPGHRMKRAAFALTVIVLAVASLLFGSADVSLKDLVGLLGDNDDPSLSNIVLDIRLPRTLLAVLVGAGVSASGAAIQGMFRNPLANPALIGVSAGAALFTAIYVVLDGSQGLSLIGMTGSAFVGGLLTTWIVLVVGPGRWVIDNVVGWHRDQCDSAVWPGNAVLPFDRPAAPFYLVLGLR